MQAKKGENAMEGKWKTKFPSKSKARFHLQENFCKRISRKFNFFTVVYKCVFLFI